jgi:peptide/nickel transport system substrate-binding protein
VVIRNMLAEIGVDVQLEKLQDAAYDERWDAGDYDFAIQGSIVDADPDDNCFNFFYSTGAWNTGKWISEEADALLDSQRATADQDKRKQAFQDLQALVRREAPHAFLYHDPDIVGFRNDVKGYKAIPEMRYLETVWLDR